jgi:RNA polymerase sigma-70 factor (ECF subfamily)
MSTGLYLKDPHRISTLATERSADAARAAARDSELVKRFNAGDESAFVEIVRIYRKEISALTQRHLNNHADAEDISQDTFINAHRGLSHFRGDASLATWLHQIAFNLSRSRWRYYQRRRRDVTLSLDRTLEADVQSTLYDVIANKELSPDREAAAGEYSELVVSCMRKLSADHLEILRLRNTLCQSYGEIARALNIGIGTVKSRIGRARESFRTLLAEDFPETPSGSSLLDWFDPIRTENMELPS